VETTILQTKPKRLHSMKLVHMSMLKPALGK